MSDFSHVNGVRVVEGALTIPRYGLWCADVKLATTDTIPSSLSFAIGNLTLQGFAFRQAQFAGSRQARMIAGFGGWRQAVEAKHYTLAAGLMLSLLLGDVAREVGEQVNIQSDSIVGTDYVRRAGAAQYVLRELAGPEFHIDPAGVTQIGPWPSTTITSPFTVEEHKPGEGRMIVATEDYASWMPGASFSSSFIDGTFTVKGVTFKLDNEGKVRLEVLT